MIIKFDSDLHFDPLVCSLTVNFFFRFENIRYGRQKKLKFRLLERGLHLKKLC